MGLELPRHNIARFLFPDHAKSRMIPARSHNILRFRGEEVARCNLQPLWRGRIIAMRKSHETAGRPARHLRARPLPRFPAPPATHQNNSQTQAPSSME